MKKYSIPKEDRALVLPIHRRFHSAVARRAAQLMIERHPNDVTDTRFEGIFKYEGGVKINGKEIAIKKEWVIEDWGRPKEEIPEEAAVIDAMTEVIELVKGGDQLENEAEISGDALRSFFEPVISYSEAHKLA